MENILGIICVHDVLRGASGFPEGFFDLVREPIRQGTGIVVSHPPGGKKAHGLENWFKLDHFRLLAGMDTETFHCAESRQQQWSTKYHHIPDQAIDYLFAAIPPNHLLLSFEIPPWLSKACNDRGVNFLDIRPSPLRFGRDLYIALRSSCDILTKNIANHTVHADELRLEASLLGANVRMHKTRMEHERGIHFENLDNALIYIGQAPYDASLLAPNGKSLRCTDYAEKLQTLIKGRRLLHKPHPFAPSFADQEREALQEITGQKPTPCQQNAYQILSSEDDVELIGISSGFLQEARWFDKNSYILYQPFVPLSDGEKFDNEKYQQIHFHSLLSPGFWHKIISPQKDAPRLLDLPQLAHNYARETIDQWWDYSKVMTWQRSIFHEAFERNGGANLRNSINILEKEISEINQKKESYE